MWTVRLSLTAAALALAACGEAVDDTTDPAAGAPEDQVETRTGGVPLPDTPGSA